MDLEREKSLKKFSKKIAVKFSDLEILNNALTHSSNSNENSHDLPDNEKLEFLGDAVLNLSICDYLFKNYEDLSEGELTKIKSHVVSAETLANFAKKIKIGDYIQLGRGEELNNGREKTSILANSVEALFAAIYLDKGYNKARNFITSNLKSKIARSKKFPDKTSSEFV